MIVERYIERYEQYRLVKHLINKVIVTVTNVYVRTEQVVKENNHYRVTINIFVHALSNYLMIN